MGKKRFYAFIRLKDFSYKEFEFNTEEEIKHALEPYKDEIVESETIIEDRLSDQKKKWKSRLGFLLAIIVILVTWRIFGQ